MAVAAPIAAVVGTVATVASVVGQFQSMSWQQQAQARYEQQQYEALEMQRASWTRQAELTSRSYLMEAEASEYSALDALNQARIADYNSSVALMDADMALQLGDYNKAVMDLEAGAVLRQTGAALKQHGRATKSLLSSQRAGYAGRMVDITTGSPLEVMLATQTMATEDAINIRDAGNIEAARLRHQGAMYQWTGQVQAQRLKGQSLLDGLLADNYREAADYRRRMADRYREMADETNRPLESWMDEEEAA